MIETGVDLGFTMKPKDVDDLKCYNFPSKIGGKPAWLLLKNIPNAQRLKCNSCNRVMLFLCQIYAPADQVPPFQLRTLFVFVCPFSTCTTFGKVLVLRSTLPEQNEFYAELPMQEQKNNLDYMESWGEVLCKFCGCACMDASTTFCCNAHEMAFNTKKGKNSTRASTELFPEFQLVIESEVLPDTKYQDKTVLKNFEKMSITPSNALFTQGTSKVDLVALEQYASEDKDPVFSKFRKMTQHYPDQVIRYNKGGTPLWATSVDLAVTEKAARNVPKCQYCGSERQYEFQIMPQLLSKFPNTDLDWAVIVIYTCKQNCSLTNDYFEEVAIKQEFTA